MLLKENGYTLPALVVITALILGLPAYAIYQNKNLIETDKAVKGSFSSRSRIEATHGFTVRIKNLEGTWTLIEKLCKTLEECTNSLESGEEYAILSGDKNVEHEIVIEPSDYWNNYQYLKVYAKEGLTAKGEKRSYLLENEGQIPNTVVKTFTENDRTITSLIIPLEETKTNFFVGPIFIAKN